MATTSASPISIPQINNEYYVGEPMLRTIQQAVTYAIADSNAGNVIISQAYTGTDLIDTVTGGSSTVFIADERNGQRQVYYWNGANYVAAAFVQDGTIMAPAANFDTIITAQGADFDTCLVASSPVRTFANTGDPDTGMEFPPAGIGVSTGTAWAANSIDPATIPRLTEDNIFTGNLFVTKDNTSSSITAPANGLAIGWNVSGTAGETDFINSRQAGGGAFYWYNVAAGAVVGPATVPYMALISNGILSVPGGVSCGSLMATGPTLIANQANAIRMTYSTGASYLDVLGPNSITAGVLKIRNVSSDGSVDITTLTLDASGNATFEGTITSAAQTVNGTITAGTGNLRIGARAIALGGGGSPSLTASDDISVVLNAGSNAGQLFFNFDQGSIVHFCDGATHTVASIDASGNAQFNGTITATTKNFKIRHPLAPQEKYLIHSCLEGPEIAVYYRGETVTANGQAEVTLPDYFEALTTPTDRSVLLTQIFEDDSDALIGSNFSMLMASRVKDGKFKIRSSEPVAKVWWEVKAVRRDVEPLVKETRRDADAKPDPTPEGPGDVGSGTPEAGKPKPEAIRPRDTASAGAGRTRKPH